MSFWENLTELNGKPVRDFDSQAGLKDPKRFAYRVRLDYDEGESGNTWLDKFFVLTRDPGAPQLETLVIGAWEDVCTGTDSAAIVEALAAGRDILTNLKEIFFGDIISEESEISWINQSNLSPLFQAYPKLERLTIRGGTGLSLGRVRHANLKRLVIQTGGLPAAAIHEIAASELPNLEHLELWLGEPNYGGDATADDLAPLLSGGKFPRLKYLGIKDSVVQDAIAAAVASAPLVARLETLDLSMGQLGDDGARALLASPAIRKLKNLDLHHHFISDPVAAEFKKLGIPVDLSEKQEPHEWGGEEHRFIAVSE